MNKQKINFAATNHNQNIAESVMASTLNTTSTAAQTPLKNRRYQLLHRVQPSVMPILSIM